MINFVNDLKLDLMISPSLNSPDNPAIVPFSKCFHSEYLSRYLSSFLNLGRPLWIHPTTLSISLESGESESPLPCRHLRGKLQRSTTVVQNFHFRLPVLCFLSFWDNPSVMQHWFDSSPRPSGTVPGARSPAYCVSGRE